MVLHVVLFEPKFDLSESATAALIASIENAARTIESVRRFEVGRRTVDGPMYRVAEAPTFPFIALIGFDDRAGLAAYLGHPAHLALGRLFHETLARALVFDYDVHDATRGLSGLLGV